MTFNSCKITPSWWGWAGAAVDSRPSLRASFSPTAKTDTT